MYNNRSDVEREIEWALKFRRWSRLTCCVAGLVALVLFAVVVSPRAQTVQDSVERTIGSLVVQNATCAAQGLATAEELRRVKAELASLRAKLPDGAKPEASSVPP